MDYEYWLVSSNSNVPIELVRVTTGANVVIAGEGRGIRRHKHSQYFSKGNKPDTSKPVMFDLIHSGDASASIVGELIDEIGAEVTNRQRKATKRRTVKKAKRAPTAPRAPGRANTATVAKRFDAIVGVLAENGGWMKSSDIMAALLKKGPLFRGLSSNAFSQSLARLATKKPARLKKKGNRGASRYRIVSTSKKTKTVAKKKAKKKVTKRAAKKKVTKRKKKGTKRG